jgi:diguanylate cyclase (GGDEF)-like protein
MISTRAEEPKRASSLPLRWQILLGCMIPVLTMLISGVVRAETLDASIMTTRWVTHTDEVIAAGSDLLRTVADADTGVNGFLLTWQPAFGAAKDAASSRFWREQGALAQLVSDNPPQVTRMAAIGALFQRWEADIAEPSFGQREPNLERAQAGKRDMDEMRRRGDEFIDVERGLLAQRTQRSDDAIARTRFVAIVGTTLSTAIAIAIALYLSQSIGRAVGELASAAKSLADGNLTRRVRLRRGDEIGLLAQSFNTMADRLMDRTAETASLASFGEQLQACLTLDEACKAFVHFGQTAFPGTSGAVYLANPSRDMLIRNLAWGPPSAETMTSEDCWALRMGHPQYFDDTTATHRCAHCDGKASGTLCVPLMAHGTTIGVFYLALVEGRLTEGRRRFVETVGEQLALALANVQLREKLHGQSIRDPLTGLFNRRYFDETLPRELIRAQRMNQSVGFLACDVDHFKRFNDTFGHEAGDMVLREMWTLIRGCLGGTDFGVRLGGEEFVIVLFNADRERLARRAERLGDAVRNLSLSLRGLPLGTVTISTGLAMFPESGSDSESLLRAADTALYGAKTAGRDRAVFAEALVVPRLLDSLPPRN